MTMPYTTRSYHTYHFEMCYSDKANKNLLTLTKTFNRSNAEWRQEVVLQLFLSKSKILIFNFTFSQIYIYRYFRNCLNRYIKPHFHSLKQESANNFIFVWRNQLWGCLHRKSWILSISLLSLLLIESNLSGEDTKWKNQIGEMHSLVTMLKVCHLRMRSKKVNVELFSLVQEGKRFEYRYHHCTYYGFLTRLLLLLTTDLVNLVLNVWSSTNYPPMKHSF